MCKLLHSQKWIVFVVLFLMLVIATPVLADYLGPNRTVTTTVKSCKVYLMECKYAKSKKEFRWKKTQSWSCQSESKPWQAYPSEPEGDCGGNQQTSSKYWTREESAEPVTTVYPPATIAGTVQDCMLQNGWCNGSSAPSLLLNANEPLSSYYIMLIEGLRNAESFACEDRATSCTLPLAEGTNDYSYWAISSWGDSSLMGSSLVKVDTVSPDVSFDITGVSGKNDWYVSPVTVTAVGADATSGVASALLKFENGATAASTTLNEGVYEVEVEVTDVAGNVSTATTTISVDTTTPTISLSVNGTAGHNGWYKSNTQITAVATDATSGIAKFRVSVDGGPYQNYAPLTLQDGIHTVQFKAVDVAGNQTETPLQSFQVDGTPPTVDLPGAWSLGKSVDYRVYDEGSGLSALRIVIEDEDEKFAKVAWDEDVHGQSYAEDFTWDGVFKDGTVAPPGIYLVWLKASDKAGNEHFELGKVIVPQPNGFVVIPTVAPSAEPPSPPVELTDGEGTTSSETSAAELGFGGTTSEVGEPTTQSILLTTGTAGADPATSSSGVLWGLAAAAAIAAATSYAVEVTRKRLEEEAAQAAAVEAEVAKDKERRAEKQMTKEEKQQKMEEHDQKVKERKERQEWDNPAEEKARLKEEAERDAAYADWLYKEWLKAQQPYTPPPLGVSPEAQAAYMYGGADAQAWINANADELRQQYLVQQEIQKQVAREWWEKKEAEEEAKRKAEQQAAQNAAMAASLPGLMADKQAPATTTEPEEKSWWDKLKEGAGNVVTTIGNAATNIVTTAGQVVTNVVTTTGQAVTNIVTTAGQVAANIVTTTERVATDIISTAGQVVTNIVTTAGQVAANIVTTIQNVWEGLVETGTVVGATFANAWNTWPETTKKKWDYYWSTIKDEPMHVPNAQLKWDNGLPIFEYFIQNQWDVIPKLPDGQKVPDPKNPPDNALKTQGVECVTTTAVDVRNMLNWYLADLTGKPRMDDLELQDFIDETDNDPDALLPVRFPTDQNPSFIAGWMHPRFQLLGTLEEFSQEFDDYYDCSFEVRQTSYNTLDDIANELQQGHLVIVHGLDADHAVDLQPLIGGAPHTMGTVVGIDATAQKVSIMNTNGELTKMDVDDFLKWWGQPSTAGVYTDPNTMTVIIPDTLPPASSTTTGGQTAVPVQTPAPSTTNTPSATASPTPTSTATSTPSATTTNTPTPSATNTPLSTQTPAPPTNTPTP